MFFYGWCILSFVVILLMPKFIKWLAYKYPSRARKAYDEAYASMVSSFCEDEGVFVIRKDRR